MFHTISEVIEFDILDKCRVQKISISPTSANQILEYNKLSLQRPINTKKVTDLAREMEAKRFEPWTQVIVGHIGRDIYLIDGQHRLSAIAQSGLAQDMIVVHRQFNTYDEIAQTYRHVDIPLVRKPSDFLRIRGTSQLTATQQNALSAAVRCIKAFAREVPAHYSNSKLPVDELIALVDKWEAQALQYFSVVRSQEHCRVHGRLDGAPVLSVALITYFIDPVRANKFWTSVVTGEGNIDSPTRVYREFLLAHPILHSGSAQYVNAKDNYFFTGIACCNAFYKEKPLRNIKIKHLKEKMVIAGCKNLEVLHD